MLVMKFGGTSVASLEMIDRVLSIAEQRLSESPVLVSSAMGKTTDALVEATELASSGEREASLAKLAELRSSHETALASIEHSEIRQQAEARVETLLNEAQSLLTGVTLIQECSPRTRDAVLSFGERMATVVIDARARDRGIDSVLLDSRDLFTTDDDFTAANVDFAVTYANIERELHPKPGRLTILQGFIARTSDGVTTTLGRGGSDYTASIVAAGLGAERVEIWTDVDGIMTTDPRVVPEATTVERMSYDEAAELAFFGARVVHPSTIQPAVDRNIQVQVRNTNKPDHPGTTISGEAPGSGARAIATKSPTTVITIHSSRMLNAYGFLARIFTVFERHKVSVDVVATSEVSVSVTLDDPPDLTLLLEELSTFARVEREDEQALISLVGTRLWKDSQRVARVFDAMQDVPLRLISLGSSDVNLTFVVPEKSLDAATRSLHGAFFSGGMEDEDR